MSAPYTYCIASKYTAARPRYSTLRSLTLAPTVGHSLSLAFLLSCSVALLHSFIFLSRTAPSDDECIPAAHSEHVSNCVAPSTAEYLPAGHARHDPLDGTPASLEFVPAPQDPHAVSSTAPQVVEYLPAPQAEKAELGRIQSAVYVCRLTPVKYFYVRSASKIKPLRNPTTTSEGEG
jgi:hypothetical protein